MMVVTSQNFKSMKVMRPWEELLKDGLVLLRPPEAVIMFVSHEWLARSHPDPDGVQLRCLQQFKEEAAANRVKDLLGEQEWAMLKSGMDTEKHKDVKKLNGDMAASFGRHECDAPDELLSSELATSWLWIDYFSVPQDPQADDDSQMKAIYSIPYYIEHSAFFITLCPTAQHSELGMTCDYESWLRRGWCRFEEWANMLSPNRTVPLVLMEDRVCVVNVKQFITRRSRAEAPGCGDFTCCQFGHTRLDGQPIPCDRECLQTILRRCWLLKVTEALKDSNQWVYLWLRCIEPQLLGVTLHASFRPTWAKVLEDDSTPELVIKRIEADPLVGETDRAICFVACLGDERILQACVDRGDDPFMLDAYGRTCLYHTCGTGSVAAAEYLLSLPNMTTEHIDLRMGNEKFNGHGTTALHKATTTGWTVPVLLKYRADPGLQTDLGMTPLHTAATFGHVAAVRALLDADASIDAQDKNSATALHAAAVGFSLWGRRAGKLDILQCLIDHRASMSITNKGGLTALQLASKDGFKQAVDLLSAAPQPQPQPIEAEELEEAQQMAPTLTHQVIAHQQVEGDRRGSGLPASLVDQVTLEAGRQEDPQPRAEIYASSTFSDAASVLCQELVAKLAAEHTKETKRLFDEVVSLREEMENVQALLQGYLSREQVLSDITEAMTTEIDQSRRIIEGFHEEFSECADDALDEHAEERKLLGDPAQDAQVALARIGQILSQPAVPPPDRRPEPPLEPQHGRWV